MKLNVFYSWQSDLPNNTNRGLIKDSIESALEKIRESVKSITEIDLVSDSRNDMGTPDLVASIFGKIDSCDIFIADISIINPNDINRKTPNPNVLIELGYAAKSIGWERIICIFNTEKNKIEDLPFDIRFRRPIWYNSSEGRVFVKMSLSKRIYDSILEIIEGQILDKKEYLITKRKVDLGMQAILFDFCKIFFAEGVERYNYYKLLNSTEEDIKGYSSDTTLLGFELYRNISLNINEFIDFFKDEIETYFLSDSEKRLIVKMVYALRAYRDLMYNQGILEIRSIDTMHKVVRGTDINKNNDKNSYILLKAIDAEKGVVVSSGSFDERDVGKLLNIYSIKEESKTIYTKCVYEIIQLTNNWIKLTGNYFIHHLG